MGNKKKRLEALYKRILSLRTLTLRSYREENDYTLVFGEGNISSGIVFVGEAPGKKEAESGKPFCGASGKKLDQLLGEVRLKREEVYITNIVKDRPPENSDPTKKDIEVYGPLLIEQLDILEPEIIAPLGRFSAEYIMKHYSLEDSFETITKIHGKIFGGVSLTTGRSVKIIPLFHPAVAIYNKNKYPELVSDMKKIKKALGK